jgi:hypothetical protein
MTTFAVADSILTRSSGYCLAQITATPAPTTDNKISKIDDLVVGADGKINSAIIGLDGFRGTAQKDVEIPFNGARSASGSIVAKIWFDCSPSMR